MFNNVALGVYYPGDSFLHRLHARTKLLAFLWIAICLIVANQREWHFAPYVGVVALLLLAIAASGVSPRYLWRHLWLLLLLALISAIPTVLFPGSLGQPLYTSGLFRITPAALRWAALAYGLALAAYNLLFLLPVPALQGFRRQCWARRLRILLALAIPVVIALLWLTRAGPISAGPLVIGRDGVWLLLSSYTVFLVLYTLSLLLTMTTTPIALIEGLTLLLAPLRWLRLPVDEFALMMLLALRFVPTLLEEANQLIKAQTARGADFSARSTMRERLQSLTALFVPLVQGTLRRAAELATALEARGYEVGARQTLLHEDRRDRADYGALLLVALVMTATLII
jgi:energy-coupling factor transport system permease protein